MQNSHSSYSSPTAEKIIELSRRWGVSPATVLRWDTDNTEQIRVLRVGMAVRNDSMSAQPIGNLSLFVQQHGFYIRDVVRLSGLTRQTLNRLKRKPHSRRRLRDLIAGVGAILAAASESTAEQTDSGKAV